MLKKTKSNEILKYSYYNSIDSVPDIDWMTTHPKYNLFFSKSYLSVLEKSLATTILSQYILFFKNDVPVGFAVVQHFKFNSSQLSLKELPCTISTTVKHTIFKNSDVNVLICGNLFSCGEHGFIFNYDQINKATAFELLSKALLNINTVEKTASKPSFILLKEFWPNSSWVGNYLKESDFKVFEIDANMVLKLQSHWHTFDNYLESLRTKFRTRQKKIFQKSATLQVHDFKANDIDIYADDINRLYLSVLEKADFKLGKLSATTFKNLKATLGTQFIFSGYFLNQKLIGFSTAFVLDHAIEANHIGIDYTYNKKYALYQKMLFDYVNMAITRKVKELRLGRTADTIKSTIGAQPMDMKLYVRHRNPISNTLLKPLIELISPRTYEIRNPFKKT